MHIYEITKRKRKKLVRNDFKSLRLYGVDIIKYALLGIGNIKDGDIFYNDIIYTNIKDIILPKEKDIFQLIDGKNLSYVEMPIADYTIYDFSGIHLYNTMFPIESTITPSKNIFQNVFCKNISYTLCPSGDYSNVDFSGVSIRGATFNKNSVLPNNSFFLQNVKDKSINKAKIYNGIYDNWDFKDVDMEYVTFGAKVTLPKDKNIFRKSKKSSIKGCIFIEKDLSYYDFTDVDITECSFIKCKFSKTNWLKNVKDKNIQNCTFIDCDLRGVSFKGIKISKCKFKGNTKISIDNRLFQDIYEKNATGVILPRGDYSYCDFTGVDLSYSNFTFYSKFPTRYGIFKELKKFEYIKLPYGAMKNLHLYSLTTEELNLIRYSKGKKEELKEWNIIVHLKSTTKKHKKQTII